MQHPHGKQLARGIVAAFGSWLGQTWSWRKATAWVAKCVIRLVVVRELVARVKACRSSRV